jgi:predicted O-methyltransferase YrrM
MTQDLWTAVDQYFGNLLLPPDPALEQALQASVRANLPQINVSAAQGKFLHLLARMQGARNVLEIGTLGGYSTIWLARAMPPGGHVITLEVDPRHAEVARANFARAGVQDRIELRLGEALKTLPQLEAEKRGPFDFIFIDADKPAIPDYFTWALKLARLGGVIIVDNVVRKGAVIQPTSSDADVQGVRRFMAMLAAEPRVSATALQTVGSKGYDGFAIAVVGGEP